MIVTNHNTGETCLIRFKPAGWLGKGQYEIEGGVSDKQGMKRFDIFGKWHDRLVSRPVSDVPGAALTLPSANGGDPDQLEQSYNSNNSPSAPTGTVLWKRNPTPAFSEKMFNFTEFAASLNETTPGLAEHVCPTDSRIRPDQKAMEE